MLNKFSKERVASISTKAPKGLDLTPLLSLSNNQIGMQKTASKVVKIAPKEDDFLYVRVRAVSAGNVVENPDGSATHIPIDEFWKDIKRYAKIARMANDNGDFFSYEELKDKYKTFIGKSAFVDHKNDNVENARGIVLDSAWNERGKFVELLIAVDKVGYPELARGVEIGIITDVSMGCRCGYSICSACGNKAVTEDDFCTCVKRYKGASLNGIPVVEDNRDIEFFEISFVTTGADRQAKILERVASKSGFNSISRINPNIGTEALVKIASETNKRSNVEQKALQTFKDMLRDLPWK